MAFPEYGPYRTTGFQLSKASSQTFQADLNICAYTDGFHVTSESYAPLQQYSGFPNVSHELLHTSPPANCTRHKRYRNRMLRCSNTFVAMHDPNDPFLASTIIGSARVESELGKRGRQCGSYAATVDATGAVVTGGAHYKKLTRILLPK
ncbi:uncharacterized protein G2W53_017628 [Senna tora]|uniref:Uncharacterized protein n=1 Tax=Senna tora TaxID=362788 RepID=A0A834TRL3_9FABA|nr:uncharacterized protein G2W53_017628 [Senna tora]